MAVSAPDWMDSVHNMLEQRGTIPAGLLAPDIYDSWMRCIALGLDTRRPPPIQMVSQSELRQEQQRHALVRGLALAEMHTLHQQIAGSNFMIAFATPGGTLLDIVSDQSFDHAADVAAIRPGCVWTEGYCGTNGLGTAAFLERPIIVQGGEHFFTRYRSLTCTAAPVFAPDGTLAGVLDATSDCLSRQTHTQALVAMAATQIENGLFREQHRASVLIAFHNRGEYLHTLSAGLLAVDPSGCVLALNRAANMLLHGLPAAPGRNFSDIFRTRFEAFLDGGRRHERQRLQDEVGSSFIAAIGGTSVATMTQVGSRTKPAIREAEAKPPAGFVFADPGVAALVHRTEMAALRKMPILIRGETGTGKEQLARYAHAVSGRPGAFVPVNCAALPETLIEAELFGYADGAFTGARKGGSIGLFREADGGTLFLDEIGDMPVTLQAVLLRFLDDWTVRPVGGSKRAVDVFLVSATNANLAESIARGRFRPDLLFRLNTLEVTLPPLRDRSDFQAVARHLLALIDPVRRLSDGAVARLAAAAWPGNIRELRNVLSRLTLSEMGDVIEEDEIESLTLESCECKPAGSLHDLQRARVLATYGATGHNVSETARRLGVSRNTVYRALGAGKPDLQGDRLS